VTVLDPQPQLGAATPDEDEPASGAAGPFDTLVANCAEVTRHLAEVPRQDVVPIPGRALAMVAGLGVYGD